MSSVRYIDIKGSDSQNSKNVQVVPYDPSFGSGYSGSGPNSGSEHEPTLKDLFSLLRKRIKLIALITAVSSLAGLFYCLTATKYYTAVANVEIKGYAPVLAGASVENLFGADTRRLDYQKTTTAKLKRLVVADRVLSDPEIETQIKKYLESRRGWSFSSLINLLDSSSEDEDTAPAKALDKNFKVNPSLLNKYLGLIDINPVHETSIVEITATTAKPKLSQLIANSHAEGFIAELRAERQKSVLSSLNALEIQGEDLRRKLEGTENELARYARENQLVAVSNAEDANVIVKQIISLTELLTQATARRVKSESLLREFEEQRSRSDSVNVDEQTQRSAREALDQAEAEYASMRQNVTDEFPAAKEIRARIASLKSALTGSSKRQLENLRLLYQSDLSSEKKLIEQIDSAKAQSHEISKRLVQYNMLLKESASFRQLYETVLRQIQETRISGANDNSNIIVSDYAIRPNSPSAPLTKLVLMAATVFGALFAILVVVLLEALNNRIRTPEDVSAYLDLPILGFIPSFDQDISKGPGFTRKNLVRKVRLLGEKYLKKTEGKGINAPAESLKSEPPASIDSVAQSAQVLTLAARPKSDELITITSPKAFVSEALRTIRASILLSSADHAPQSLMVTSAEKGEGKTTVTANLAVAFAQAGHSTLVIDADLRQSRLSALFNIPTDHAGLSDYLAGHRQIEDIICTTAIENADVLVSGSVPPNPAELLGSKKMKELIESLRGKYDFILIDCPPVLPVADGLMVSRVADAVVFVTRSNVTERGASIEARRRLGSVNARILGVILNDLNFSQVDHHMGPLHSHSYYSAAQG